MPRALITPNVLYGVEGPYKEILESAGFELVYPPPDGSTFRRDKLLEYLDGIDCVLASVEPYTADVLDAAKIRAISRMGVGYDSIDVSAATERGVVVTITAGANEQSVAEMTIALMTGVMRGFPKRDMIVRQRRWDRTKFPRLGGKTLGLVGLGRIGRAVVPKAQGLGLRVIAYDPYPNEPFAAEADVRLVSLDDLLAEADIVSLHLPSTPDTQDLINRDALAKMKPGSVLINTSRGGMVDEDALIEAMKSGRLMAAGLDVYKVEPLPDDSPLRELDNVLLSPHAAGLDEESEVAMGTLAAQNLADLYQGRWPEACVVNRELGPDWKW